MNVWHVYIDKDKDDREDFDFRAEWPHLEDPDKGGDGDLPFSDRFGVMKLFRTRKGAEKYAEELAERIRKFFDKKSNIRYFCGWERTPGMSEIVRLEAADGGQFDRNVVVRSVLKDGKPGNKVILFARIKAVLREVKQ